MTQPMFIWQREDWPRFRVREAEIASALEARMAQGRIRRQGPGVGP